MAALVQTYPQQTATVGMLHSRPNSASGMLQTHQNQQYSQGGVQPRNQYNGIQQGSMGGPVVYRGSVGPVQPYAFTSTPSLNQTAQWQPSATSAGSYRASSTSAVPQLHNFDYSQNGGHNRYLASASMTNLSATSNYGLSAGGSRDDSSLVGAATRRTTSARPHSALVMNAPTLSPTGTSFSATQHGTPAKPSPERYRRPAPQQQQQQQQQQAQPQQRPGLQYRRNSAVGSVSSTGTEESQLNGSVSSGEVASRRARRRSMPAFSAELPQPQSLTPLELDFARQQAESGRHEQSASPRLDQKKPTARIVSPTSESQFTRPVHTRTGSSDSRASARSNSSRPSSVSHQMLYSASWFLGRPLLSSFRTPQLALFQLFQVRLIYLQRHPIMPTLAGMFECILWITPCKLHRSCLQSANKPAHNSLRTATPLHRVMSPQGTPPLELLVKTLLAPTLITDRSTFLHAALRPMPPTPSGLPRRLRCRSP